MRNLPMINAYFTQCVDPNQGRFNDEALKLCKRNSSKNVRVILVDNGSYPRLKTPYADQIIRLEENVGGNAIPWHVGHNIEGDVDISCFFHADMMIVEKKWDVHVAKAFEDPKLALLGFVGSNEIGRDGGRGSGTMSNFQGREYKSGKGSPAEHHGRRIDSTMGVQPAACLDFCAQIYRTSVIHKLEEYWVDAPVMHFEDRVVPVKLIGMGWRVGVLGIACDHLSGAKSQCAASYDKAVRKWLMAHENEVPDRFEVVGGEERERSADDLIYSIAEYRYLSRYRDRGIIPFRVKPDYSLESIS